MGGASQTSFVDTLFNTHLNHPVMLKIFFTVGLLVACGDCMSVETLQDIATALSEELWSVFNNVTTTTLGDLETALTNQSAELVDAGDIAQQAADYISTTLATVKATLLETAGVAEALYSNNQNQNCCSSTCQYGTGYDAGLCSVSCNVSSIQYISSGRQFGIETGQNETQQCVMGVWEDTCSAVEDDMEMGESAVHIPRDMHEEDPAVLCFVQWTDLLTEQFSINSLALHNSTHMQYVGSDTRLLRFSPPSDWSSLSQCRRCPLTLQDTFELGRRPWYTNTVSGEKYFVILLDVSGSMAGFRSILARTTIAELLKALTPNDYFQIIQVGEGKRTKALRCFTNKTRATPENVLVMNQVIQSLSDMNNVGRAHFASPMEMALRLLGNSTECHRVLIIFTDGERETPLPTDDINDGNKDRGIQVFTFLVGYGQDNGNLETVACKNGGRMGHIREYSDVIPAVLLITDSLKLNQSPSSSHVHYTAYRDVYGSLALTMGRPLWISDQANDTRKTFGIVAFDIAHHGILNEALQNHSIGASGYGFIADNNGQLITHPLISHEYIQGLSDDNLLSLDVDYYEHPHNQTEWLAVRGAMLSGGRGQHSLLMWSALEREEMYVLRNTTYSYAPVTDTPYILVLVTPSDLWLVATPTVLPNKSRAFIQLSSALWPEWVGGNCERLLQRIEGRPHHSNLNVVAGVCGNESTALLRPLWGRSGQVVGVAGTTLLPGDMEELLTDALTSVEGSEEGGSGKGGSEEGGSEEGGEVYLIDDMAVIVAASPYDQSGWFPELSPAIQSDLVSCGMFLMGSIHGYELRPEGEGEREGGGEGEGVCELELYEKSFQVYQLAEEGLGLGGRLDCGNSSLKYVATRVPNTTLTLIAVSGTTLDNQTDCFQRPIRLQRVPCVCACKSCERYRRFPPVLCPNTTASPSLCASLVPHPSLLVVVVTGILTYSGLDIHFFTQIITYT